MKCVSGKKIYSSEIIAEEALIDAHIRNNYTGTGPIAVYRCEDCGYFHFTSKGQINKRLAELIVNGTIKLQQQANDWSRKWKK